MVVLDCDGVKQRTVPDAEGKFVFSDVPQGACTVSAVATVPSEAAAPQASSAARAGAVTAPRDAASGMATGKRQHKPMSVHVMLDGEPSVARVATADASSRASVSVMVKERRKELTGHVTLIK
jgi:predicted RecA/RadA family phage recombinase